MVAQQAFSLAQPAASSVQPAVGLTQSGCGLILGGLDLGLGLNTLEQKQAQSSDRTNIYLRYIQMKGYI